MRISRYGRSNSIAVLAKWAKEFIDIGWRIGEPFDGIRSIWLIFSLRGNAYTPSMMIAHHIAHQTKANLAHSSHLSHATAAFGPFSSTAISSSIIT